MLRFAWAALLLACTLTAHAQLRSNTNPALAPFFHGVASGDPLADRVIIWTRVTPPIATPQTVNVDFQVATDTGFANVIFSGTTQTDTSRDYTVKVDVTSLLPGTYYYYRFTAFGNTSATGRTKTLPDTAQQVRLAIVSCSDYTAGFFNVYEKLAERNDLDVVLHLGDYIYEYAADNNPLGRQHVPATEILTIDDYRARHSLHKLDPDLAYAHQLYPFICVWDDHESANNSWSGGAENHTEGTEGQWVNRLDDAARAYNEWIPIREPQPGNNLIIYRQFDFGSLMTLLMLDTRIVGRDLQASSPADASTINDPNRTLLGATQRQWLLNKLDSTNAQWKLLGQQVMFAPLGFTFLGNFITVNTDQWDGYAPERQRILDTLESQDIDNLVVLTGDIHTAWANDVPLNRANYVPATGAGSRAVEFVCHSVTSGNGDIPIPSGVLQGGAPWIKYADLDDHGYVIVDVDTTRCQGDFWNINQINNRQTDSISWVSGWFTNTGNNHLQEATQPVAAISPLPIMPVRPAENPASVSALAESTTSTLLGVYPNPFADRVEVQLMNHRALQHVRTELVDANGRVVKRLNPGVLNPGLQVITLYFADVAPGTYTLVIRDGQQVLTERVIKLQ